MTSRFVFLLALASLGCMTGGSTPVAGPLGLGRPATSAEIAALDIDVMPDGTGLPAGRATAADGAPLYAARCAGCHGPEGEMVIGTPAGRLVGRRPGNAFDFADALEFEREKSIGSWWPYATTLFDYVRRAMPFDRPGSLTDQEVYAVTAWLLARNGIIPWDAPMDAESLPRIVMPARDRFRPDDRLSANRVR